MKIDSFIVLGLSIALALTCISIGAVICDYAHPKPANTLSVIAVVPSTGMFYCTNDGKNWWIPRMVDNDPTHIVCRAEDAPK